MKKIFKRFKPVFVFSCCLVATLLSGCTTKMMMSMKGYDVSPKVGEVNQAWLQRNAVRNKTKDVDILHKLCKPTTISQLSDGGKSYMYHDFNQTFASYSSKTVSFHFNQNGILKNIYTIEQPETLTLKLAIEESVKSDLLEGRIPSDKELLALLETVPKNPTRNQLIQKLGQPRFSLNNVMTYVYIKPAAFWGGRTQDDVPSVEFVFNSNGVAEHMVVPKSFYDAAKKSHARLRVKTIYAFERKPNDKEAAVIEKCEK